MSISDTQRDSFEDIKKSLSERRGAILELIELSASGLPLFEIVQLSELPINSVSGRITELCDLGLIKDSGCRQLNPETGRKAIVWVANSMPAFQVPAKPPRIEPVSLKAVKARTSTPNQQNADLPLKTVFEADGQVSFLDGCDGAVV